MVDVSVLAGLVPFTPIIAAFLLPLVYIATRSRYAVFLYTSAALALTFVLSTIVAIEAYRSGTPIVFKAGGWPAPIGIVYIADMFTSMVAVVSTFLLLLISIYSVSYITDAGYPWYSVLLLGVSSGILGVTYTGDMFNLFVMLEVTSVSSYALVMYYMNRADSLLSGLKYAFIGALGTTLYLLSMGIAYSAFDTLNFVDFANKLRLGEAIWATQVAYGLVMVISFWAFSIKSGLFPNHFWLPDAHPAAPTPISALLSGLVVNTGVVGLYKFLYYASWSSPGSPLPAYAEAAKSVVLMLAIGTGAASAVLGALLMFIQRDVKRLIAYSTIMNLGYLFMAAGCPTTRGLTALLYYMTVHSVAKATLFLSAGVFIKAARSRDLSKLAGLGPRYRIAGAAMAISALTLAGLPPLPGFLAKVVLYEALFEVNIAYAITMVVASAIGMLSYIRLLYTIMLEPPVTKPTHVDMVCAKVVLLLLSVVLVVMGVLFLFNIQLLDAVFAEAAKQVTLHIDKFIAEVQEHIVAVP